MSSYKEILISPMELKNSTILNKRIIIKKSTDVLVMGTVLDRLKSPIVNAVISIKEINNRYYPPLINSYGYIITNTNGEYAVLLPSNYKIDYILDVYEPIIKD
ncbi:hypothetical protein UT300005_07080 [Clostridium sp. CTA-5]